MSGDVLVAVIFMYPIFRLKRCKVCEVISSMIANNEEINADNIREAIKE